MINLLDKVGVFLFVFLQFFLKESDLGLNRATCSLPQLSTLNPHVRVSEYTEPVDEDLLLQFQVLENNVL